MGVALALSKLKLLDSNDRSANAVQKNRQNARVFMELAGFIIESNTKN
jgi:hypothetical protein